MTMSKAITIDGLQLTDIYVVQAGTGQYMVKAVYSLLSGQQVVLTCNQDVTTTVATSASGALAGAFGAVGAALAAQWTS
jgi:hypothetical protein